MFHPPPSLPQLVPTAPSALRSNNFNAIRIAMALMVVWSHCFALYYGTEAFEPVSLLLNGQYNAGEIAVRVFFIVSGFLITQSFLNSRTTGRYLAKRVRRVYPGFLAATAICTFIVVPSFATEGWRLITPGAVFDWLWRGLTLQELIPPADAFRNNPIQAVNGALWSIRYEFWFYLCLAALGVGKLLTRRRLMLLILLGAIAIKCWLEMTGRKPGGGAFEILIGWPYVWFSMAPFFLVGSVTFLYGAQLPRSPSMLAGLLLAMFASAHLLGTSRILFDMLCPLALAYALFYIAFARVVRWPGTDRLGDASYGTYLYGFPIQQMVKATLNLGFPAYLLTCLTLSLIAGLLSWHLIEKRFPLEKTQARPSKGTALAAQGAPEMT
ncbi:acyltransferase [Sphingobium aromaticiconvertens]|uniref:acyltransferase family protein n=1 Tax=Sphingobium aromaticiconvertens TaxID=365341 RepID=UPI00301999C1